MKDYLADLVCKFCRGLGSWPGPPGYVTECQSCDRTGVYGGMNAVRVISDALTNIKGVEQCTHLSHIKKAVDSFAYGKSDILSENARASIRDAALQHTEHESQLMAVCNMIRLGSWCSGCTHAEVAQVDRGGRVCSQCGRRLDSPAHFTTAVTMDSPTTSWREHYDSMREK